MKNNTGAYLSPAILTAIMIASLSIWVLHAHREITDRSHSRQKQRFDIIASNLLVIDQHCMLKEDVIRKVVNNSKQNSPFNFFMLEKNGKAVLTIGKQSIENHPPSSEGEMFDGDSSFFWKTIRTEGMGEQTLVMKGSLEKDRGYNNQIQNLIITALLAFLLISVNLVAWIMVIRSRRLAEQLESQKARSAYLEDLELAAAGLAHETKNPLGIISGIAQQISGSSDIPDNIQCMVEDIIDEVDKAASRLGHFLNFARHREVRAECLELRRCVLKIAGIMQAEFDSINVSLDVKCPEIRILADDEILRQILVNLLLNSLHASSGGEVVRISASVSGDLAEIAVEDYGCGIKSDLLPNIFKPYVAGNPDGHGLGLAIVKRLTDKHGWAIKAESAEGKGTVMKISGIRTYLSEEKES